MPIRPALLSFDVFGTILDWRSGLRASLSLRGRTLSDEAFDRIVDRQGALEQAEPGRGYAGITAQSQWAGRTPSRAWTSRPWATSELVSATSGCTAA